MPPNSEIEKLERRWKENPKGTVFAPYAEVLRKHGDYPLAKEILRLGLELHPDHIPGNIVLGRCCLDLGEEGPAEAAFVHVLELDAENVIALKALADITERQGRLMEAASWLNRLITVDPSNDEAREQRIRVDKAREAASAAIVEPIVSTPVSETEQTVVVSVIEPAAGGAAKPPETEVGAGEVGGAVAEGEPLAIDADAAVEAALGPFDTPAAASAPAMPVDPGSEVTVRVTARPRPEAEPEPTPVFEAPPIELEPAELDLAAGAAGIGTASLADLTADEPFQPPAEPVAPEPTMSAYALGVEEPGAIELRPSGLSEFQAPDDSTSLLDLSVERSSEFQQPDASQELRLTDRSGSEYQTPSGAEELLKSVETEALLEPEAPAVEAPPPGQLPTSGFAAISLMATEEIPMEAADPGSAPAAGPVGEPLALESEPADAVSVVEMLTAASTAAPAAGAPAAEPEPESAPVDAARATQDLPLIFPDQAEEPEPPRIRRISDEVSESAEAAPAESAEGEPAPVMTETMGELYARQGHLAEAVNVFRALASGKPGDARIAARLRELEDLQTAGRRRMSYVAVETGGESVESFFRTLSGARPGTGAPAAVAAFPEPPAAPTRPASDPLSLSAIFDDEPAGSRAPTPGDAPQNPSPAESFSFDQFFAGGGTAPSGTGPRSSTPPDEDLDQFQNWLKSLKR